ncbi:hypothetical protein [Streptomyces sp. NPDC047525]|uniref:hypothetical protein n=1 Tax=Streptomyces sp. NPDC047525 TaxID=3155264 RepID=UPI003409ECAA
MSNPGQHEDVAAGVTVTADGLYARPCVNPAHSDCTAFTFAFESQPANAEADEWTVVGAGTDAASALVQAQAYLTQHLDADPTSLHLLEPEQGEPGATSLYGWADARDCQFAASTP